MSERKWMRARQPTYNQSSRLMKSETLQWRERAKSKPFAPLIPQASFIHKCFLFFWIDEKEKYYNSMGNTLKMDQTPREMKEFEKLKSITAARHQQQEINFNSILWEWMDWIDFICCGGCGKRVEWGWMSLFFCGLRAAQPHGNQPKKETSSPMEPHNSSFLQLTKKRSELTRKEREGAATNQTRKEGRGRLSFVVGYGAEPICAEPFHSNNSFLHCFHSSHLALPLLNERKDEHALYLFFLIN